MRTVIIEDDELDLLLLKGLLAKFDHCQLVGCARSACAGLELIHEANPELIFLDIDLAGENSIDHFSKLEPMPLVVCISGHDEYALQAFDIAALDFISKPVTQEKLCRALQRAYSCEYNAHEKTVLLQIGTVSHIVPVSHIIMVRSEREYCTVLEQDGRECSCRRSLREWDELLAPEGFKKLDRSTLINLKRIDSFSRPPAGGSQACIMFDSGQSIKIGATAYSRLKEFFS